MNKFLRAMIIMINYLLMPILLIIVYTISFVLWLYAINVRKLDVAFKELNKAFFEGIKQGNRANKEFWKDGDLTHFGF